LRSLFFGSLVRKVFSTVLILVVVAVVVVGVGVATGVFGVPTVEGTDNRIGSVNETDTVIETDIQVNNPNPVGISLGGVSAEYNVSMNDIQMARGTKDGLSIESGSSTVSLRTSLQNERIPDWWVTHVENGEETNLNVNGTVESSLLGQSFDISPDERSISTDIDSALDSSETRPINVDRPLVDNPVLYLNETSGSWGGVNDSTTEINMEFVVYNPSDVEPIPVTELGYSMTMNDVAIGSGQSEDLNQVPPGETATIQTTTVMQNEKLDEWWVSHLKNDQVTDLEIAFSARVDLSDLPGGIADPIEIPLDTVEHQIDTDIFGNKNETGK
jgi:LEA14-like dessication related protein